MPRPAIKIRMCRADEGAWIRDFLAEGGNKSDPALDWSNPVPFWLIAEVGGTRAGVVNICPSRPNGRIESLHIDPTLPHRFRALIVRDIILHAVEFLRRMCQCTGIKAMVSYDVSNSYKRILRRHGCYVIDRGVMYQKVLGA